MMSELWNPFNYWIPLGILAFGFAVINLIRTMFDKSKGWQILLFLSLSCGVLEMYVQYLMINQWVAKSDWSALMDVVPSMSIMFTFIIFTGIILNGVVLRLNLKGGR